MARTIYKYEVDDYGQVATLELFNPKIVHYDRSPGTGSFGTVWVEHVVDHAPNTRIELRVHGTGHPIADGWEHVGSIVSGPFVWHLYQKATPL